MQACSPGAATAETNHAPVRRPHSRTSLDRMPDVTEGCLRHCGEATHRDARVGRPLRYVPQAYWPARVAIIGADAGASVTPSGPPATQS